MKKWLPALGAFIFFVFLGSSLLVYTWVYFPLPSSTQKVTTLYVAPGTSIQQIGKNLKSNKLIWNVTFFKLFSRIRNQDRKLMAGYYIFHDTDTLRDIVDILAQKKPSRIYVRLTIPEGYSIHDIADLLEKKHLIKKDDFLQFCTQGKDVFKSQYDFLNENPTNNIEGYLFPDTYFISYGMDSKQIVNMFLKQFDKTIYAYWKSNATTNNMPLSFHNYLTMASIIEKEAKHAEEMPTIAQVFYNRIKKKMPLASDPTVIYALGLSTKGKVYYSDLKVNSPYNTYINKGLPPTPIGAPGLQAFKSALAPSPNAYLFFVANQQTGKHVFTKNYKDHLAVQRQMKLTQKP